MASSHMNIDVMTVRDMINDAIIFADCRPTVNLKMLESSLYILARNLNILKRQIEIKMGSSFFIDSYGELRQKTMSSRITVAEMKIHTGRRSRAKSTKTCLCKPACKPSCKRSSIGGTSTDVNKKKKSRSELGFRHYSKEKSLFGDPTYTAYAVKEEFPNDGGKFKTKQTEDEEKADVLREKLLIVSRTPSDSGNFIRDSVVTEEQFERLSSEIRKLQAKFGLQDMFAESDKPWKTLHKPISLTDPKAALNMSARLEAVEIKLTGMLDIVKTITWNLGLDITKPLMDEELLVPETEAEKDKKLATWTQLMDGWALISEELITSISTEANDATSNAKNAINLLTPLVARLIKTQQLNVKVETLNNISDRFVSKVIKFDRHAAWAMSDCQDKFSQVQSDLEAMLECLEDTIAHPKQDPRAVDTMKDRFTNFQYLLINAKDQQAELKNLFEQNFTYIDMIQRNIEDLCLSKTTREEVLQGLNEVVNINDVNKLLSKDEYHAVVEYIKQTIRIVNAQINNGESEWQKHINDYVFELYEKADPEQLETLSRSINMYTTKWNITVGEMLEGAGPYTVTTFEKKLDREGNCLSCGTPANPKVRDCYMKFARERMNRTVVPKTKHIETQQPCTPGRPIPHPLDPRGLICERFCGASYKLETGESLASTFGLDIVGLNRVHTSDELNQVYLSNLNTRCTPCTHSKDTLFKKPANGGMTAENSINTLQQ